MAEADLARRASVRRVTLASTIGSAFEWYDFMLSAMVAAVVCPFVFFENVPGALATALSVATYAIAFVTRPLGAYLFGHLGDKHGRKSTLITTLVTMGVSRVIAGIALILGITFRYFTAESLLFEDVKKQRKIERFPASRVLIEYPKQTILLALATFLGIGIVGIMLQPYSVSYLVARGFSPSFATGALAIGGVSGMAGNMVGSVLAQVLGRKRSYLLSIVAGMIFASAFFFLIGTLNLLLIYLSYIVILFIDEMGFGVLASIVPEQYPTRLRYSGTGLLPVWSSVLRSCYSAGLVHRVCNGRNWCLAIYNGTNAGAAHTLVDQRIVAQKRGMWK